MKHKDIIKEVKKWLNASISFTEKTIDESKDDYVIIGLCKASMSADKKTLNLINILEKIK